jgi:cyclic pyranopterin phosphate synthase
MDKKLSHFNEGQPEMVDVGDKHVTRRKAKAQVRVVLPVTVFDQLERDGFITKKGGLFSTANIAGVMAVKKTADLIPLCHPLAISKCALNFAADKPTITITCEVILDGKTGVEMEALTGCSVAALTVYDMCKALSHDIRITDLRLIEKSGGKNTYIHEP